MGNPSKKSWLNHPWTLLIAGAVLTQVLIPAIISNVRDIAFGVAFSVMWDFLLFPVQVPVLPLAVIGIWIIFVLSKNFPFYRFYAQDMFYGMIWKWEIPSYWNKSQSYIYVEKDEHYCPICDMKLKYQTTTEKSGYHCVNCDQIYSFGKQIGSDEMTHIYNEVARRIRTGAWKWHWLRQKTVGMKDEVFNRKT